MTISVLMSVYKSEKAAFLDRSLQSVWDDQTLKPNQIVLILDGELTEPLYATIDVWKEKLGDVLTILKNEQNLGLTKSLNKGIKVVTSDLIARMDSDDISTPERFRLQHDYLMEHPDVDIVGGFLQEFDETNDCLNVRRYPQSLVASRRYIKKASPLAHPTVMMRKKMFDEGLAYDERFRTSQDVALWYDAILKGYNISNVPEVTIKFRRDGDVFKRRGKKKAFNEFKIYMNGIYRMHGIFCWYYVYPISRLAFRLMPTCIVKYIYGSKARQKVLQGKG